MAYNRTAWPTGHWQGFQRGNLHLIAQKPLRIAYGISGTCRSNPHWLL